LTLQKEVLGLTLQKKDPNCFTDGGRLYWFALLSFQFENNYFTEMCSGSEAGSYLRLMDFVYHSTLGLRVIKKKRKFPCSHHACRPGPYPHIRGGLVFKAHRLVYHSTLGSRVIKKKKKKISPSHRLRAKRCQLDFYPKAKARIWS